MIYHLINTQVRHHIPQLEKIPYWLTSRIGFHRVENWLYRTWWWGVNNALESHDERPWSSWNRTSMLNRLYPDDFFF